MLELSGPWRCTEGVRVVVLLVLSLLMSCTAGAPEDARRPSGRPSVTPAPTSECPVTLPNRRTFGFGTERLWVVLWPRGHARARRFNVRPDGSLALKFPWTRGVRGELSITGRRLDAPAAPARARVPGGYGSVGFQSTAVVFPTPGCWEVTGEVGDASLRFVTRVSGPADA